MLSTWPTFLNSVPLPLVLVTLELRPLQLTIHRHLDEIHYFKIPGVMTMEYVVKLRPGLHQFLKSLREQYDLFIYTHGTRIYAEAIAEIIDPDDTLFRHRIVARTDTPDIDHKSLKVGGLQHSYSLNTDMYGVAPIPFVR